MWTKVVKQSRALKWLLAPALFYRWPEPVEMHLVMGDIADHPLVDAVARGAEAVIPAPVVEDAEQAALFLRQGDQRIRFGKGRGERLVDYHMLVGTQRRS